MDAEYPLVRHDQGEGVDGRSLEPGPGRPEPAPFPSGHGLAHAIEDQSAQRVEEFPGSRRGLSSQRIQGDVQTPLPAQGLVEFVGPWAPRVETGFGPQLIHHKGPFLGSAGRAVNLEAPMHRQLYRGRPHAATSPQHQDRVSRAGMAGLEKTDPSCKEHHGDSGGPDRSKGVREGKSLISGENDVLRVPAEP